jgi:hypothetical protein
VAVEERGGWRYWGGGERGERRAQESGRIELYMWPIQKKTKQKK